MRVSLLTLRFEPSLGCFDDRPLEELLAGRELIALREHFFQSGGGSYLLCVVEFGDGRGIPRVTSAPRSAGAPAVTTRDSTPIPRSIEASERKGRKSSKTQNPDPLADLTPSDRPVFDTLRAWRSDTARRDGVPPYVVLTNKELVALIRARPMSKTALAGIEGIGKGKLERYGDAILERLLPASAHAAEDARRSVDESATIGGVHRRPDQRPASRSERGPRRAAIRDRSFGPRSGDAASRAFPIHPREPSARASGARGREIRPPRAPCVGAAPASTARGRGSP